MAHSSNFLIKGLGNDRQWVGTFQLLDDSGNVMFSVDQSGAVTANGSITSAGSADNNGNITITNSAPFLLLADNTASAKQLKIKCDANLAQLRETSDSDGSLLVLDLANDRVGIGVASPTVALDIAGALNLTGALTGGSSSNITINTNKFTVTASSGNTLIAGTLSVTGTSALTGAVTITAAKPIIGATASPASNGTGTTGMLTWDGSYLYICTNTNTWARVAVTGGY